jgi:hypothetical protein
MWLRLSGIALALCLTVALAASARAQREPSCDLFALNESGDWVAKQNMTVLGLNGPVSVHAGQPVPSDARNRIDAHCK